MDTSQAAVDDPASAFYADALALLEAAAIPFLIGGAFAYSRYSQLHRETKDLDLFLRPSDVPRTLALFDGAGYRTDLAFPHWLAKVYCDELFIDLIFSSGNGVTRVDDLWFEHAIEHDALGRRLRLCPPEEMIWSKAFVQERERFDGADVLHLIRTVGPTLDWEHLLKRFGADWPVLLSHLVLFRFVYPDRRHIVPEWVVTELMRRFAELRVNPDLHVCRGTLLSREQYLPDVERFGYEDARVQPHGSLTPAEAEIWTAAIDTKK
jgi:hypothetical protein